MNVPRKVVDIASRPAGQEVAPAGLVESNFVKISSNGFGEPHNSYPHAMNWFKNRLYVCVTRAVMVVRGVARASLHPELIGEIWPVKMPANLYDIDLRSQIWRYDLDADHWQKVYTAPLVPGSGGFDVPESVAFRNITVFQGESDPEPALYIPGAATSYHPEAVMLRTYDGEHFETVSRPGLGIEPAPRALRGLVPFNGRLFTSPVSSRKRFIHNIADEMIVLVNRDPAKDPWRPACEPHFGNPNNLAVFSMGLFNDHLYAGTANIQEGFEIWKTDAKGTPPYQWQKVVAGGAGRGGLSQGAITFQALGDYLYVGTGIQEGGYDAANNVGPAAPEIIRISRDDSWELVVGDPRLTEKGFVTPLSGHGAGFGDPFTGYFWSMAVHDGWLYVGSLRWLTHLQFASKDNWPKAVAKLGEDAIFRKLINRFGGFSLWRTRDGRHWVPVTGNGFGNCYNYGIRNMVSTRHGLFVGVANPYTPQVAVRRFAGWHYENNVRGGLEIWRGTAGEQDAAGKSAHLAAEERNLPPVLVRPCGGRSLPVDLDGFFKASGFRHLGLWTGVEGGIVEACESLVNELLSAQPEKKEAIADLYCGLGATTRYIRRNAVFSELIGIAADKKDLACCRSEPEGGPGYVLGNRAGLKKLRGSFGGVLWARGLFARDDPEKRLAVSYDLLREDGVMAGFEMIRSGLAGWRTPFNRPKNEPDQQEIIARYGSALRRAGFADVRLVDVTTACLIGFRKYRARYFSLEKTAAYRQEEEMGEVEKMLWAEENCIRACLLVSAKKPGRRSLMVSHD